MQLLFCVSSEAAIGGVLQEKMFLEILQNYQENTFARVSFLIKLQAFARVCFLSKVTGLSLQLYRKRDSVTGVFLGIL